MNTEEMFLGTRKCQWHDI